MGLCEQGEKPRARDRTPEHCRMEGQVGEADFSRSSWVVHSVITYNQVRLTSIHRSFNSKLQLITRILKIND